MILEPNREEMTSFVEAVFKHADPKGYVSLRTFVDNRQAPPVRITGTRLTGGLGFLVDAAMVDAYSAANNPDKLVFSPPVATFNNKKQAREVDLVEGLALNAECDKAPAETRAKVEQLLGEPTVLVESGGQWTDPKTGEVHSKLHIHYRLNRPAQGVEELKKLKEARSLLADIVGSDPSNKTIVHPLRWPGSWHRKKEPKLCRIVKLNAGREIDLDEALAVLRKAAPQTDKKSKSNGAAGSNNNWAEPIEEVLSAESYHEPLARLAAMLITHGMGDGAAVNMMRGLMEASAGPRDERWQARYDDIPRAVATAEEKFAPAHPATAVILRSYFAEELEQQPVEPVDWSVEDFIPSDAVTGFFGDGGHRQGLAFVYARRLRH